MRRCLLVFFFGLVLVVACGGAVTSPEDARPTAPSPVSRASCAAAGGRCGPTPDLPCLARTVSVDVDEPCKDFAPCCLPLPIPADGHCWEATDCTAVSGPLKLAEEVGSCEGGEIHAHGTPGSCRCAPGATQALGRRCGPVLAGGQRLLCGPTTSLAGRAGVCGATPCAPGGACIPSGGTAVCVPHFRPNIGDDPRPYCAIVDCGDIRCDAPLRCVDDARGVCAP